MWRLKITPYTSASPASSLELRKNITILLIFILRASSGNKLKRQERFVWVYYITMCARSSIIRNIHFVRLRGKVRSFHEITRVDLGGRKKSRQVLAAKRAKVRSQPSMLWRNKSNGCCICRGAKVFLWTSHAVFELSDLFTLSNKTLAQEICLTQTFASRGAAL